MRLRRRIADVFLLFLLIWVLYSCSGASLPDQHISSPLLGRYLSTPPMASTPAGRVVFAGRVFPKALNPLFSGSPIDLKVSAALWSTPVVYDNHFHVQPNQLTEVPLPENGDVRDGGKTVIMRLRHDLRWSDGQPLLSSDFSYGWRLNQDPHTGAIHTDGYDQIASIETPDDFTVILHMKNPFGPYLLYLPFALPAHAWQRFQPIDLQNQVSVYLAPTVTDGPYRLAQFVNQQSYTLTPDHYYTSTTFHGPYLATLIYRAYNSLPALIRAFQSGQADLSADFMEYDLPTLAHLPSSVTLITRTAAAYEHLDFNLDNPWLKDVRVRRALQMAINVCGLLRTTLHMPDCSRHLSQVEPPPSLVYDPSIHINPYDPLAARKLLGSAGWSPGPAGVLKNTQGQLFVLHLVTTAENPLRAAIAASIKRDLNNIGIDVTVLYYPLGAFFGGYTRGGILATGTFDLALFGYANSPEPDDEYNVFHSSQVPSMAQPDLGNYERVRDSLIDQSLQAGRLTVDIAARRTAYHQFLERLAAQVYIVPLFTDMNIFAVSSRLQNVLINPDPTATTWNISDWWQSAPSTP